jgi:hypothetical protein
MPIQNYGDGWRIELSSYGRTSPRGTPVDFAGQIGVYILYDEQRPVYIGRDGHDEGSILSQVKAHRERRDKDPWDTFSWVGFRPVGIDGSLQRIREPSTWYEEEIRDNEALLVYVLNPPNHLRSGDYRHIPRYFQVPATPA